MTNSASRLIRVLMLGWEYPPRYAGGLGKACRGLSQAMAKLGTQVFFVLPSFPDKISEERLEVIGAREVLIRAGWQEETVENLEQRYETEVKILRSQAQLFPYGQPPHGPAPRSIRRIFQAAERRHEKQMTKPEPESSVIYSQSDATEPKEIYGKNLWSEIERFNFSVRQLARTHTVDCVHAHDWMTFPAAFEFSRATGVPVFLHVHATEYDRAGENVSREVYRIEREGFRKAQHIFAVSRYTAGILERLYGVDPRKITVAYNAPDEDVKELIGSPGSEREPNVVFLGRLTFQKGPEHFLKAASIVAQYDSKARFVFCGSGDLMEQLRQTAADLGLTDRVSFPGFVDPAGVDELLRRSRVLVMPSVSEPFGLVALEAIHCGVPVILSKQSGVREVLQRALQVDFWDHERLADQILASLRLPSLSEQLVHDGMEEIQELSWEKTAQGVLKTYRAQIGEHSRDAMEDLE